LAGSCRLRHPGLIFIPRSTAYSFSFAVSLKRQSIVYMAVKRAHYQAIIPDENARFIRDATFWRHSAGRSFGVFVQQLSPILFTNSESWTLRKNEETRLEAFEM